MKKKNNRKLALRLLEKPLGRRGNISVTGFTLSELMIAALILGFTLVGILLLFINCLFLNESSRNSSLAYSAMQTKMEELSVVINPADYDGLDSFNGINFDLNGFSAGRGKGRITVSDESGLKKISLKACYMNRNKLIGDDINNCQSTPVELITLIAEP